MRTRQLGLRRLGTAAAAKADASSAWQSWMSKPVSELLDPRFTATNPNFIARTATVSDAASQMISQRKSFLMVAECNAETTFTPLYQRPLLGIATERSILASLHEKPQTQVGEVTVGFSGRCSTDTLALEEALCAAPGDSVGDCLRLMHTKIYRHLPVMSVDDKPLGILKIRDMLKPLAASMSHVLSLRPEAGAPSGKISEPGDTGWWSAMVDVAKEAPVSGSVEQRAAKVRVEEELCALESEMDNLPGGCVTVSEILREKRAASGVDDVSRLKEYLAARARVHTVGDATQVDEAAAHLLKHRLTFLITVDERRNVSGIASERHFLEALASGKMDGQSISAIATPLEQMITVSPTNKAVRCLALMLRHNIRHLPVVKVAESDGTSIKLDGILSIRDLLKPFVSGDSVESPWGLPLYVA
jgi:CBS domain-containing protein